LPSRSYLIILIHGSLIGQFFQMLEVAVRIPQGTGVLVSEWWQTFFDEDYLVTGFRQINRRKTLSDIRFIRRTLPLRKGSRILDVCCGIGRHALELSKLGYRVTGVDYSQSYIEIARKQARKRGLRTVFEQCDMRTLPYRSAFDSAICMWTSFGYFDDESDNLATLKRIHRSLKPGGRFLVELINRDWLLANFEPLGWRETKKGYVLERRQMDILRSRLDSEWIHTDGSETSRKHLSLRVYSVHELVGLLADAGFKMEKIFGDRQEGTPTWRHRMNAALVRRH
jgi:SAM-dependent methyltransferase